MDVFTLLKQDHAQVAATIKQVEATDAPTQRQQLFNQIKQALDVHAHIEETIFYPVLKQAAETREITLEAYDEHQDIKDLLAQLAGLPPDDEEWTDTFDELKQTIEHHVDEEENEMFVKARDVLSPQQIEDLGTRMEQEKQQQLQQPKAASAR
ncbi:MAG: hemerythrin domain-containing protein [Pyrinomonadaceae bacterium]